MIGAKIGKTMGKGLTYLQNRLTIVNLQVDYEVFGADFRHLARHFQENVVSLHRRKNKRGTTWEYSSTEET